MTIKLIVASRNEILTKEGPQVAVMLLGEEAFAKVELSRLPPVIAASFPLGRKLEIEIPTFTGNHSPLVVPAR